ncbi:MAG: lipoyl(octanoyl) transferase LipB [Frankia sp.]
MDLVRLGAVDYQQAWDDQRARAERRAAGTTPDTLLLLTHPSVYTAGRRTEPWERPLDGTPVIDVDRGGKITWHGPGQLVGYPIIALPAPLDVVGYVRALEGALIAACADLGLATRQVEGRSGVWTTDGGRKLAAIGIRVTRGVAYHGFAVNCDCDLAAFGSMIPCGITDAGVTSLSRELARPVTVDDAIDPVERRVVAALAELTGRVPAGVSPGPPVPAGVGPARAEAIGS